MSTSKIGKLVALALLFGAARAHAADGKVYPGVMCSPSAGGTYLSRDNMGGTLTVDSQTTVWCPILGDSEAATTAGLDIVRANIWEASSEGRPHTACTAYSYSSTGLLFDSNSASAATWGAYQSLNLPLTKTGGPTHPRYLLKCVLAGPTTLQEYEIEEQ